MILSMLRTLIFLLMPRYKMLKVQTSLGNKVYVERNSYLDIRISVLSKKDGTSSSIYSIFEFDTWDMVYTIFKRAFDCGTNVEKGTL